MKHVPRNDGKSRQEQRIWGRYEEIRDLENRTFEKRSEELGWFSMGMREFKGVNKIIIIS